VKIKAKHTYRIRNSRGLEDLGDQLTGWVILPNQELEVTEAQALILSSKGLRFTSVATGESPVKPRRRGTSK